MLTLNITRPVTTTPQLIELNIIPSNKVTINTKLIELNLGPVPITTSTASIEPIKLKPIRKYTFPIFLERARLIHGDKYDYSRVTPEHVKSYYSIVPLKCKTCGHEWDPSIGGHINERTGCPSCAGTLPWTFERFLKQVRETHGDKFNYDNVKPEHIKGLKSHIHVICNTCKYEWEPPIGHHIISGTGCPRCYGNVRWTLDTFLERAKTIHGDKFDYSQITTEHIQGQKSKVPLICNTCGLHWNQRISVHINNQNGCPKCFGNFPWNLERLLQRVQEIHGDKYDYSNITDNHVKNLRSRIPIICKTCKYSWNPTINGHIHNRSGCLECAKKVPWNLERVIQKSREVHGDKYDYSRVTPEHVHNYQSLIPIICNRCNHLWEPRIHNHITQKTGCPKCRKSHGELECINFLESRDIEYDMEFRLESIITKRFDFRFEHNGRRFLVEYDGAQHFMYAPYFHADELAFVEKQHVDILKTQKGIEAGYCVIRIDYTQINDVGRHLEAGMNCTGNTYFSTPTMYEYLTI